MGKKLGLPLFVIASLFFVACGGGGGSTTPTGEPFIQRVSVDSAGTEANLGAIDPSTSADGRFVVFTSDSDNLVAGDNNGVSDIFRRDTQTNTTIRVSEGTAGLEANGSSYSSSISGDGRHITFISSATNLVPNDNNAVDDIFVHDVEANTTSRISVSTMGTQANGASGDPRFSTDGNYVVFESNATNLVANDNNGVKDIFLRVISTDQTVRMSDGNADSRAAYLSADGLYVVFESDASNLVANDNNNVTDIFVRDLGTLFLTRVNMGIAGAEANQSSIRPRISGDGRYVTFVSSATNLVANDTNAVDDIFVRDTLTNITIRVSVDSAGVQANGYSFRPRISGDGRYVAYESSSDNLVTDDTNGVVDVFSHDVTTRSTIRVSLDAAGNQATGGYSHDPDISADGRYVVFQALANNLDPNDSNGTDDIFLVKNGTP